MNTERHRWPADDDAFDHALRALHDEALTQVSTRTRTQLQQRRRAATAPAARVATRGWRLALGTAMVAAVLSVAYLGAGRWHPLHAPRAISTADPGQPDVLAVIDETPDLYLWLASDDARQFAKE